MNGSTPFSIEKCENFIRSFKKLAKRPADTDIKSVIKEILDF